MRMRWSAHVARVEMRNAYSILIGKHKRKRPLGRSRRRWKDNVQICLRETGCEGLEWIRLDQDRDQ